MIWSSSIGHIIDISDRRVQGARDSWVTPVVLPAGCNWACKMDKFTETSSHLALGERWRVKVWETRFTCQWKPRPRSLSRRAGDKHTGITHFQGLMEALLRALSWQRVYLFILYIYRPTHTHKQIYIYIYTYMCGAWELWLSLSTLMHLEDYAQ